MSSPPESSAGATSQHEWLGHIDVVGLELEALYGGVAREPFTDNGREYVFIARRPFSSTTP